MIPARLLEPVALPPGAGCGCLFVAFLFGFIGGAGALAWLP